MNEDNLNEILNDWLNEARLVELTKCITREDEVLAKKQCDAYLNNLNRDITNMLPLAIYYIIISLDSSQKIIFIKENISYIKKNDEDVFLYTLESPKALAYYLDIDVIKEIYRLDKNIFRKMLNGNFRYLVNGFNEDDYLRFYIYFYEEIKNISNDKFVENIYYNNRLFYDYNNNAIKDWNEIIVKQEKFNNFFISFLVTKYKEKINTFDGKNLLNFIYYCDDINLYKEFINNNLDKLKIAIDNMYTYQLVDYIEEMVYKKALIFIPTFINEILNKDNLRYIFSKINFNIVYDLYIKDNTLFNKITLSDWIYISNDKKIFDSRIKIILDAYEIEKLDNLFNYNYIGKGLKTIDLRALEYIEKKYRNSIITDGNVVDIDECNKLFSNSYFKNLKEVNNMLENGVITKNSNIYKDVFKYFVISLGSIVKDLNDINIGELEKLFYRILKGNSLTILYKISSLEDVALYNRIRNLDIDVDEFSIEQINKYNVKEFNKLCRVIPLNENDFNTKKLILKLYLLIGYEKAKFILKRINSDITILEHLVGNVYVKDISFDNKNNIIFNERIINMLFNDKGYYKIVEMLFNKDSDLYKYFPRIFNEWNYIKSYNKDKSINMVIEFLKSFDIALEPKYYRLIDKFKYIGCNDKVVGETLMLHDKILKRTSSNIPRVYGNLGEYSYEVLKMHDMDILSVGSITNCCFSILNGAYSSLKHACLDGRVLVVKKDDKLIAHSWLWRNGNVLCLDNIEVATGIREIDFLDVYLKFADNIINESIKCEEINAIRNVTIGYPNFSKSIIGINNYPCLISKSHSLTIRQSNNNLILDKFPTPIEEVAYLDSKNVQYLIKGKGDFNFYKSTYAYLDERDSILYYNSNNSYDEDYLKNITNIINGLRYIKLEENLMLNQYECIDLTRVEEIYCNEDWYYIIYKNNIIEEYINSNDERALIEKKSILKEKRKVLVKDIKI